MVDVTVLESAVETEDGEVVELPTVEVKEVEVLVVEVPFDI